MNWIRCRITGSWFGLRYHTAKHAEGLRKTSKNLPSIVDFGPSAMQVCYPFNHDVQWPYCNSRPKHLRGQSTLPVASETVTKLRQPQPVTPGPRPHTARLALFPAGHMEATHHIERVWSCRKNPVLVRARRTRW